ncbi:TROVE domain-containing protein [Mariniluteicoccus flavus]
MINDILTTFGLRRTPQHAKARADQVCNTAGGWTFELDDAARLRRFLVLGTDGGTFYVGARELTRDNAEVVVRMAENDPETLLATIEEVSLSGAAPRPNATLFALAIASSIGDADHRRAALALLPKVARTGTHLFLFAGYVEQFRGWGRGLRRAVAGWYADAPVEDVAYQVVKYRSREGWSHRDLLRLAHPATDEPQRRALFSWVTGHGDGDGAPEVVGRYLAAQTGGVDDIVALIEGGGVTWEMLPPETLGERRVWEALVRMGIPMTALLRNLGRLTALGVLAPGAEATRIVVDQFADAERVRRARLHPLQVLTALTTYANGHGVRGGLVWEPVQAIVDAMDALFYKAFQTVEPTGKRVMLALDVSGSMGFGTIAGSPITPAVGAAAMALVTAATERDVQVVAFSDRMVPVRISPRQRLDDVVARLARIPMGATDVALPMQHAIERGLAVDAFVVYTDNETWFGAEHPFQALRRYRETSGIAAKLVVVGMTATGFTVADPDDGGMLDVVGFDAGAPAVIGDFVRG